MIKPIKKVPPLILAVIITIVIKRSITSMAVLSPCGRVFLKKMESMPALWLITFVIILID